MAPTLLARAEKIERSIRQLAATAANEFAPLALSGPPPRLIDGRVVGNRTTGRAS